jgi:predicted Zn-ribbon and HTH transcriptional regulator
MKHLEEHQWTIEDRKFICTKCGYLPNDEEEKFLCSCFWSCHSADIHVPKKLLENHNLT